MKKCPTLETTLAYANMAHNHQVDKAGQPYILHPIRVMLAVKPGDAQIVALLHDVVEDTNVSFKQFIDLGYPKRIIQAIISITKDKSEDYDDYISRCSQNKLAASVKMADLIDNLDANRLALLPMEAANRLRDKYQKAWQYLFVEGQ